MSADRKVFVDTNVLVYLFDVSAPLKQQRARSLVEAEVAGPSLVISTQVLQEFYVSVTRKLAKPLSPIEAEKAAHNLAALHVIELDTDVVLAAIRRSREQKLSLWDALIVEAALEGGCRVVLSEDLQHGRQFGPLRIENPFRL